MCSVSGTGTVSSAPHPARNRPLPACVWSWFASVDRPGVRVPSETHRTKTQNNAATFPAQHPTRRAASIQKPTVHWSLYQPRALRAVATDVKACRRAGMQTCRHAGALRGTPWPYSLPTPHQPPHAPIESEPVVVTEAAHRTSVDLSGCGRSAGRWDP